MRHVSLPFHIYVFVDNKYLDGSVGHTLGVLHGLYARMGQVVLTDILLETGAHWSGVPIHGISSRQNPDCNKFLDEIQPWGAMGEELSVSHLDYLEGLQVEIFGEKWKGRSTGLVLDWYDGYSRYPQQHKCLHLLEMDSGHYTLQPNNYIRWRDPSFVVEEDFYKCKNYRRSDKVWYPEDVRKNGSN